MKINFYKILIRSPLLLIAPEIVWKIADLALTQKWFWSFISKIFIYSHPKLNTNFAGIELDSPVGLAAGYDKNCKYLSSLETFGFGYLIGGTVTFDPRPGNPKPRMIRIPKEKALVNSLGFPGKGLNAAVKVLNKQKMSQAKRFISVSGTDISDIKQCIQQLEPFCSAIELNISSPNTKGLRIFQEYDNLKELIEEVNSVRTKPLIVKMPPFKAGDTLNQNNILKLCKLVSEMGAEGLTISNTLPTKTKKLAIGEGGLSGAPLFDNTIRMIKLVKSEISEKTQINACGGISNGKQASEAIKAGATTVQIWTSLIYEGPCVVKNIKRELVANL